MRICIISYYYPGRFDSIGGAFVKQLVEAFARRGNACYVISPYNLNHFKKYSPIKEYIEMGAGSVTIFRPWYLSFSNLRLFGHRISSVFYRRAVNRAFRMLKVVPDVVYGHFWGIAFEGYEYALQRQLPLFVASGESEITFRRKDTTEQFCDYVKGVVCVSTKNKNESVSLGLTTPEKCFVAPNAINNNLFRVIDKAKCREKLGFPQDVFIVAFVGWFDQRKGSRRVSDALKAIKGRNVYSIFLGKGTEEPDCPNILFKGAVEHNSIPEYLNAADVFVLPTLHEGCCNAIIEALACGLPVVSSDLSFNDDVLTEENSIRIDPMNIQQISNAIEKLYDNRVLLKSLHDGALAMAQNLTIDQRAEKIEEFIKCNSYAKH